MANRFLNDDSTGGDLSTLQNGTFDLNVSTIEMQSGLNDSVLVMDASKKFISVGQLPTDKIDFDFNSVVTTPYNGYLQATGFIGNEYQPATSDQLTITNNNEKVILSSMNNGIDLNGNVTLPLGKKLSAETVQTNFIEPPAGLGVRVDNGAFVVGGFSGDGRILCDTMYLNTLRGFDEGSTTITPTIASNISVNDDMNLYLGKKLHLDTIAPRLRPGPGNGIKLEGNVNITGANNEPTFLKVTGNLNLPSGAIMNNTGTPITISQNTIIPTGKKLTTELIDSTTNINLNPTGKLYYNDKQVATIEDVVSASNGGLQLLLNYSEPTATPALTVFPTGVIPPVGTVSIAPTPASPLNIRSLSSIATTAPITNITIEVDSQNQEEAVAQFAFNVVDYVKSGFISQGLWELNLWTHVDTVNSLEKLSLRYRLYAHTTGQPFDSANLVNIANSSIEPISTVSPNKQQRILTSLVPYTDCSNYDIIYMLITIQNSDGANHTGSVFFESDLAYSHLHTSLSQQLIDPNDITVLQDKTQNISIGLTSPGITTITGELITGSLRTPTISNSAGVVFTDGINMGLNTITSVNSIDTNIINANTNQLDIFATPLNYNNSEVATVSSLTGLNNKTQNIDESKTSPNLTTITGQLSVDSINVPTIASATGVSFTAGINMNVNNIEGANLLQANFIQASNGLALNIDVPTLTYNNVQIATLSDIPSLTSLNNKTQNIDEAKTSPNLTTIAGTLEATDSLVSNDLNIATVGILESIGTNSIGTKDSGEVKMQDNLNMQTNSLSAPVITSGTNIDLNPVGVLNYNGGEVAKLSDLTTLNNKTQNIDKATTSPGLTTVLGTIVTDQTDIGTIRTNVIQRLAPSGVISVQNTLGLNNNNVSGVQAIFTNNLTASNFLQALLANITTANIQNLGVNPPNTQVTVVSPINMGNNLFSANTINTASLGVLSPNTFISVSTGLSMNNNSIAGVSALTTTTANITTANITNTANLTPIVQPANIVGQGQLYIDSTTNQLSYLWNSIPYTIQGPSTIVSATFRYLNRAGGGTAVNLSYQKYGRSVVVQIPTIVMASPGATTYTAIVASTGAGAFSPTTPIAYLPSAPHLCPIIVSNSNTVNAWSSSMVRFGNEVAGGFITIFAGTNTGTTWTNGVATNGVPETICITYLTA